MSEDVSAAYEFYEKVLGSPKYVLAPMVEQSELAFRSLCREYGAQLCYTPMWHAALFVNNEKYRKAAIETAFHDRPLLFQFCANDPQIFAEACALAEPYCDGVDLNLGCPQVIAARGHYGSYLMEELDLVEEIVKTACARITKPITCKIRVYESIEKTVTYAKRLERAGAKILTVHGRRRDQKGPKTGLASWDHIKAVKENVQIPVFANGNIQYLRDVIKCLEYTKVDGIMSAEGALCNPAIFSGRQPPAWEMADSYLAYAEKYTPPVGYIRGHLFRIYLHCLSKYPDLRIPMGLARSFDALKEVCKQVKELCLKDAEKDIAEGKDSEEPDCLPYWRCQPYVRPPIKVLGKRTSDDDEKLPRNDYPSKRKLLQIKHQENGGKGLFRNLARDKWPLCKTCGRNPWGQKCEFNRCRKCCKDIAAVEFLDCKGHKWRFQIITNAVENPKATVIKSNDQDVTGTIELSEELNSDKKNIELVLDAP
ncbi:tRNA-dihydrouridine(16/17) synthase [NAD(P)(+)]-like isoform X1 [Hydra vulgaris]|uniref:tRNA-dihydrouridine(16/17) synthase [NAD(P)(+)] n=1 Tax=Hydra vulgaris TaxID=6087 RepID=T2MBY1_HYDVU|nr:tRNA-dihydrouridine(16/17) synthase [NAD(P)(+)]-like [Hydra vulgaris]